MRNYENLKLLEGDKGSKNRIVEREKVSPQKCSTSESDFPIG